MQTPLLFLVRSPTNAQTLPVSSIHCSKILARSEGIRGMDMMLVKSEINENRRRVLSVATGPSEATEGVKCIKRRRREPALAPIATSGNKEGTAEQSPTVNTIKRSSRFRGVSRHRWTGRFEAHLWDKGSWNATQRKKGKQVYLGAYDEEESAARAYDLAALKYWGPTTFTNFPVTDYEEEIQIMQNVTKEEYLASLRRKSSGFSRGVSKYRGVARHHHNGRWEARIGRVFGNKYLYLGTYSTQEEAAHAYDIAAIEYRGINAVTNFDLSTYIRWLRPGTTNALNNPQEPQPNTGQLRAIQQPINLFPASGGVQPLTIHRPFPVGELQLPCKQEFMSCPSPGSKSSPTALGLLLRSSMFQQLVEKNSNAPDEEIDGDDAKDQQLQLEPGDLYNGILYKGIVDGTYVCTSNSDNAMTVENDESTRYYDRNEPGIWNGVLGIQ